ncbi:MAG: chorismate synthase [Bacteroidota bacterium]
MSNTFGDIFKITVFGESHGKALGGIIDGCIAGIEIDALLIKKELARRSAGHDFFSSSRNESDVFEILSGMLDGKTTGGAIAFTIANTNAKSKDYLNLDAIFRPSHADFTYFAKYGTTVSAGKLQASARIFASVVFAGAIAKQLLSTVGISMYAFVNQIGNIALDKSYKQIDAKEIEQSPVRCPDAAITQKMLDELKRVAKNNDSVGGKICCVISGCQPGLGDPIFEKLQAKLAHAMLSINAVKGFEYGSGFDAARMTGSQHNDLFVIKNKKLRTITNNSGGIQGGISNGEDIYFNVACKPTPTIGMKQKTVDREANPVEYVADGRHDTCFVSRAVPIVEAMAALVIADTYLKQLPYAE